VRHSRNLLDDRAQQKVAGVIVFKFRPRLESEIAAAILLYKFLDSVWIAADILEEAGKACIAWNAGRVSEQVVDRYFLAGVFAVVGQVIRELAVELDLPFLDELHYQHRRELLRYRPEPEFRVRGVGDVPFHIRHPIALLENHAAFFGDQDRPIELALLMVFRHQRANLCSLVLCDGKAMQHCNRKSSEGKESNGLAG